MPSEPSETHRHKDVTTYRSPDPNPIAVQLRDEINQTARIRQAIMRKIEDEIGRRVVSFYTSFVYPVIIDDGDAATLDGILQSMDLSQGLTLILSSPGGSGVSAERIINVCRVYSRDNFEVIVPGMAKSAATMICLGAKCITMSDTSELGPIDPQVFVTIEGRESYMPANVVVESYERLLQEAIATKGRIEPYLQLLSRYDPAEIRQFKEAQALGEDIAKRALQTGMMKAKGDKVGGAVSFFSDPKRMKTHERPIFWREAQSAGLTVKHVDNRDELWLLVSDLHQRADFVVSTHYSKIVETCDQEFGVPAR